MNRCRSCNAPIVWADTRQGRVIPLDLEPVEDGNLRLERLNGTRPVAIPVAAEDRRDYPGALYRAHFASCPQADEHRRARVERVRAEHNRIRGND